MSDDLETIKGIVDKADSFFTEVYKDSLSPSVKAIGNVVALPFQAIDAALSGAKIWVAEKQYNLDRTKKLLALKLEKVDPNDIVTPENYVAVPALQQISYCYDSEELREMYANLLAASMQKQKKWNVHPAFVDIIKQLTPDEAKLLKLIPHGTMYCVPLLQVRMVYENGGYNVVLPKYTDIGEEILESPLRIGAYLDNLERLQLIKIDMETTVSDKDSYERLKKAKLVEEVTQFANNITNRVSYQKGSFSITSFGVEFIRTCI